MKEIVFLLEEPSAKAMLEGLLPKLLPETVRCRYIVFEGKQDLEKQLIKRLQGYRTPHAALVVLRDKDAEDCLQIKKRLTKKCQEGGRPESLVRIACNELESWYLGDLLAVEVSLGVKGLAKHQNYPPYDHPDKIVSPAKRLRSIVPAYQKIGGSRKIGPKLRPDTNLSHSFGVFVSGVRRLVD